jgi:hypothetical protein
MPDEVQTAPDQGAADSSPAPATFEIPKAGTEAYAEWRMNSGRTPDEPKAEGEDAGKPKEEASAPSKSESPASEAEPKTSQEKKQQRRSNEGDRISEILGDVKALGLKPSDLKLSREEFAKRFAPEKEPKEARSQETGVGSPAPAAAAPQPPTTLQPPKKPEFKDFNGDYDAFDAAKDKYFEDLADYKAKAAVEAERIAQAQREAQKTFRQKLDEAKERYGAEADEAIVKTAQQISGDQKIHPAVKVLLDESPVLADLLYVMGSKPQEFEDFIREARERPGIALRRAVLLEKLVQDELAKNGTAAAPKRDSETGQFVAAEKAEKPAPKKTTAAPPPPSEVSGRGSPPVDEAERASKEEDFRTFRAIENRRALARIRGQW